MMTEWRLLPAWFRKLAAQVLDLHSGEDDVAVITEAP